MNNISSPQPSQAVEDFRKAHLRASMLELTARLSGRSTALLSFDEVSQKLKVRNRADRGLQDIPLAAIVGSVGRYTDFTRDFLPLLDRDERRWVGVKRMMESGNMPPIEVYQIGEAYFVVDGNHRVSVAHHLGHTHIEAFVTEFKTEVPLSLDDRPDDLIIKAEYAAFLDHTHFHDVRPEADLAVTAPGQYWELETHLAAHHFLMTQEQSQDVTHKEAVADWYDHVYLPTIQDIRGRGILRDFPDRTETDLFLWIFRHRLHLEEQLGWHIEAEAAAADLLTEYSHRPKRVAARLERKLRQRLTPGQLAAGPAVGEWREKRRAMHREHQLFADILVSIEGDAHDRYALDMALTIARHEDSHVFGLYVVSEAAQKESQDSRKMRAEFLQRCQAAGILGEFAVEVGDVVDKICKRAQWADLIVMYPADPPGAQFYSRFTSRCRNVIHRSSRPVLTVPDTVATPERILLAYDGSPKAQEGLFVATHLATEWGVSLTVVTIIETKKHHDYLIQAQQYLQQRHITAEFLAASGAIADAILKTAAEQESDLIIMGGYGVGPLTEIVLGSHIDQVLRESHRPILVCR